MSFESVARQANALESSGSKVAGQGANPDQPTAPRQGGTA